MVFIPVITESGRCVKMSSAFTFSSAPLNVSLFFLIKPFALGESLAVTQCIILISFKITLHLPIALKFTSTLYVSVRRQTPAELSRWDQMASAAGSGVRLGRGSSGCSAPAPAPRGRSALPQR